MNKGSIEVKQGMIRELISYAWHSDDGQLLDQLGKRSEPQFWELHSKEEWTQKELEKMQGWVKRKVRLDIFTVRLAAAWLGMTESGLKHHIKTGAIRPLKPGHDLLFTQKMLFEFVKERKHTI